MEYTLRIYIYVDGSLSGLFVIFASLFLLKYPANWSAALLRFCVARATAEIFSNSQKKHGKIVPRDGYLFIN